jgi:hypothetical protein
VAQFCHTQELGSSEWKEIESVTGPYGSGKSSVIHSYQKREEEKQKDKKKFKGKSKHFINISLADFSPFKHGDHLSNQIELKILQQLFYHEEPETLCYSGIKRIINYKNVWRRWDTVAVSYFLLLCHLLFDRSICDNRQSCDSNIPETHV